MKLQVLFSIESLEIPILKPLSASLELTYTYKKLDPGIRLFYLLIALSFLVKS